MTIYFLGFVLQDEDAILSKWALGTVISLGLETVRCLPLVKMDGKWQRFLFPEMM